MATDDPRFGGIARLYGTEALARLQGSHMAVVGIGGVGSWAAEALARTGIGRITLIDMDDICVTNTNRQLPAMAGNIGRLKVEVMAERIRAINPACEVRPIMGFVTPDTLAEYITPDIDCVVDCIDTTGGAGGQIDPTQIRVADLSKTVNDPLAAKARSLLRRDHNFPRAESKRSFGVPCVYSLEQLRYPKPDGSVCQQKSFVGEGVKLDCSGGFGSVTMVTATFGMVAASRAVERLLR